MNDKKQYFDFQLVYLEENLMISYTKNFWNFGIHFRRLLKVLAFQTLLFS